MKTGERTAARQGALKEIPNLSLYVAMMLVFLVMALLNGPRFLSITNIRSMAYQLPIIGLLSVGMMISMLSGGINLSLIANTNFNGIVIALALSALTGGSMREAGPIELAAALAAGFAATVLVGLVNGSLIAYLGIPAILVTLGTMTLLGGVNIVLTRGYTISGFPDALITIGNGLFLGVPIPIFLFAGAVAVTSGILSRTRFGLGLYMMGANEVAAAYSNIDVRSVTIRQFILSSAYAYLTSLVMIGQLNSVKSNYAESYLLVAVLASFLGGVNPNGGFGRLSGVVAATVILQLISSGLNLLRMDPFMITAMWGGIIIILILGRAAARAILRPASRNGG